MYPKENKIHQLRLYLEQLKNRRLKQLSKEEKQWLDISAKAQQQLDELKEREIKLNTGILRNYDQCQIQYLLKKQDLQLLIDDNKQAI